ncbi:unnamed protein product [Rotaria sordida]|uniref:Uncharacterized protein n=1 Tax=Rotaria sordida TaxID=392033 RepID=A0A814BE93_9BILA|nr:unnamed protein product [Rotaria sordida]CAF1174710.1 unnamed protein product [Rotaria sordida]CAF1585867.1 unnamed protein product [Rotaria sordida]
MSSKLVKWCAHPSRHKNCTKVDRSINHPKGKRSVRTRLANSICKRYRRIIGDTKVIIKGSDYLYNTCYNFEYDYMIKKDGTAKSIQDDFDETIDANDFICSTDLNEKIFEEKNDELMDIETLDMNDFSYSQLEALKVLNELFHLLKIEPVNDIRHTNKLREKLDSVNIALNNLCETILNSKTTMLQNSNGTVAMDIKLNDYQSLLNGIKQFFILSKKEQQIQLLTIASPDWGRKKIEYYFGCTEHQSKQAILLRKSHGTLAQPVFFSGNSPIQKATIDQVVQFYEDDKINRQFSNKKDRIKSRNKRSDTKCNIEQLIKSLLCTSSAEQCYSQKCRNC